MSTKKRAVAVGTGAVAAAAALLGGSASNPASAGVDRGASADRASANTVVIWADRDRERDITSLANTWARKRGLTVKVIAKAEQSNIRSDVLTVKAENAPDVILGAHDWVGQLAANGLIVPLVPKKSAIRYIPKYTLDAFSYGKTTSRLYGMPTHVENVGLFVNTKLARVPKSWTDLEQQALRFKKKGGGRVAIDVQQGLSGTGDAYHMYPFFSGLCGYIFGRTKGGALNPKLVGLDNKVFMKNAPLIDRWNKEGLINAKIDSDTAKSLFTSGKAAFWVTGPWNIDTARKAGIKFKIVQMPKIKCQSAPFLGVGGVMVTKFASGHGVASAAKDFVGSYMASTAAQTTLSVKNGRYPANTQAAKKIRNTALRQIGLASAGGIPMPNIPQMDSVWGDLGTAWLKSTKGAGATKARVAFKSAARSIRSKIAGG
jgi:arabinogalactan oligomer / maltooligosaccharide transport system substrate-binding protein